MALKFTNRVCLCGRQIEDVIERKCNRCIDTESNDKYDGDFTPSQGSHERQQNRRQKENVWKPRK